MTAHSGGSMTLVVALFLCEPEHPQGRDNFELGRDVSHGVCRRADSLHQTYQRVVGYLLAVYLNALVEAVDKWRSVQAHPIPRRLQAGRQHGGSAALAVGTRHMDEAKLLVGVAQRRQQSAGAAEARLVAGPLDSVDVFQSGFVIHRNASFHFLGKRLRALVARIWFSFSVKWQCAPRGPEVGRGVSNPPSLPLDSTLPATS